MFMQSTSDSSIWRSLAVAFGDGLAFGVGMKLTQNAARHTGGKVELGSGRLSERVEQLEEQIRQLDRAPVPASAALDQKVLEAIVNALEARLHEHSGQVERRLADVEAKIALECKALDQQDQSLARRVAQDIAALHDQVVSLNREFGEAVGRIVAEQVASQVEARGAVLEARLEGQMAAVADQVVSWTESRSAGLERTLEGRILFVAEQAAVKLESLRTSLDEGLESRVAAAVDRAVTARSQPVERKLREEIERKDSEIAEMRQRLSHLDTNVVGLISGIGQLCRQAAEQIAPPAAACGHSGEQPSDSAAEPETPETPLPGFAQPPKPSGLWRVPLVSSVVVAAGGLVLMHFI